MIEFVTPRDGAFGASDMAAFVGFDGQQADEFGDEPPRSAWLMAMAAVIVTALIGVGIIAAAPWDSTPQSAPATSAPGATAGVTAGAEPATTNIVVAESATVEPTLPQVDGAPTTPGLLLGDSDDLQLTGVYSYPAGVDSSGQVGSIDLWSTPDATRTAGRWLAIASTAGQGGYEALVADAVRVDLGGRPALLSTSADGVFTMHFTSINDTPFEMAGFGMSIDELVRIATTVTAGRSIDYGDLTSPGAPLELFALPTQLGAPLWSGIALSMIGTPESSASYLDRRGGGWVGVQTAAATPEATRLAELVLPSWTAADKLGIGRTTVVTTPAGVQRSVALGSLPGTGIGAIAQWIDDGRVTTVLADTTTPQELLALVAGARQSEPGEWSELVQRSQRGELEVDDTSMLLSTQIGQGTLTGGRGWQASTRPGVLELVGDNFGGGFISLQDPPPALRTYSTPTATFVVATWQWPSEPTGTLRVRLTATDGTAVDPVDVPMVVLGQSITYMGAHGFSEAPDGTAEILDVNGTIVATLDL